MTTEKPETVAVGSDGLLGELEYIAASPAQEHGGFHPRVVAAATAAKTEILRLRLQSQADAEWGDAIYAMAIVRGLRAQLSESARDKARLDWLDGQKLLLECPGDPDDPVIVSRGTIDAAMASSLPSPNTTVSRDAGADGAPKPPST